MTATARRIAAPVDRAERLRQVQAGVAAGLTQRQIADMLGVSHSAIRSVLNDPDGSKQRARREGYVGECVDCGGETRSNGTSTPSSRCPSCAKAAMFRWTHESVIEAIRAFADRYGRAPTVCDFSPANARQTMAKIKSSGRKRRYAEMIERFQTDGCWPAAASVVDLFGSFGEALIAAGFETNPRSPRWSRELILQRIRDWAGEHDGSPPRMVDWLSAAGEWPTSGTVQYHFGSFRDGLIEAGFHPEDRLTRWDRESIVSAIQAYVEAHGVPPKTVAFNRANGLPSGAKMIQEFGSIRAALQAAGYKQQTRWNRDSIADVFRQWRSEHGEWPRCRDWTGRRPEGYPTYNTVYWYFSTWDEAVAYAENTA